MFDANDTLTVRKGALAYGSALYATRRFAAGEVIASFRDAPLAQKSYLTVQVGLGQHVQLDVLSHLNHSCRPNTLVDAESRTVTAARDIEPDEILSFFYPSTEWEMDRPFICQCGAPDCVRLVAGARYLSADVLARGYVNLHIVQAINTSLQNPAVRRQLRGRVANRPVAVAA